MAAHMNFPTFKGVGDEDMDQFSFIVELLRTTQNVANDAVNRAQLSLALKGRSLDWHMGYIGEHANIIIEEIKNALKKKSRSLSPTLK